MAATLRATEPPRFRAFIGLGANLGPAREQLQAALARMAALPWTRLEAASSFYVTKPVGAQGPDYLNAVASLDTALGPHELLRALLGIELRLGRERPWPNAPRTIDLDLLWMDGARRRSEALTLPHPRLFERAFVLEPLAELLGHLVPKTTDPVLPSLAQRRKLALDQGIALE
ncbi:MAG: 2-amino-4-hydroxy-6-hydroxymethyldihydropteridine diphosphokinase [Burkholderiales bacterium]|nr:2-amino-4-hydroxy-6-hydroxymethyldihydropteridine diphosphokinase [Burkholderiales bacterium]